MTTTSPSEKTVQVRYVGLAAYLYFKGNRPLKSEWNNGRCTWTFPTGTEELIREFESGEALVDPKEYHPILTEFKRMMYDEGYKGGHITASPR
jgi:hypothetical protein